MDEFMKTVQQTVSTLPVWFWIFPAVMVLYFVGYLFYAKKAKNKKKNYLEENPTYSSIYCEVAQKGIKTVQVYVNSIDGDTAPLWFPEGARTVYVVAPGTHTIETHATTNRPGIMYKNVNETIGPAKIEVEVGEAKKYVLGYDVKKEDFTFTEMTK